jgi:RNA polymerase sigma-70 factor (ECF subfamily)
LENTTINIQSSFLDIKDQLASYLYRLTANKEDMEDLLHDTFIRVSEKIETFEARSSFKTWVFTIATNLAKDNKRVKNRWEIDAQDKCKNAAAANLAYQDRMMSAYNNQLEKQFDIKEHINFCFTCIAKNLSLEKQITIVLKEIYDFKRTEIAEILGISEGVVKHLLFDGRKELQEKYQNRCALINKNGVCYQCSQLNNYFQKDNSATNKIAQLGLDSSNNTEQNLDKRFELINKINPLTSNGANLEDTILQILRETIKDN